MEDIAALLLSLYLRLPFGYRAKMWSRIRDISNLSTQLFLFISLITCSVMHQKNHKKLTVGKRKHHNTYHYRVHTNVMMCEEVPVYISALIIRAAFSIISSLHDYSTNLEQGFIFQATIYHETTVRIHNFLWLSIAFNHKKGDLFDNPI